MTTPGLPLTTTSVAIARRTEPTDSTEDGIDTAIIATGIPSHLGSSRPREGGGITRDLLTTIGADIQPGDKVTDEKTGFEYIVDWCEAKPEGYFPRTVAQVSSL